MLEALLTVALGIPWWPYAPITGTVQRPADGMGDSFRIIGFMVNAKDAAPPPSVAHSEGNEFGRKWFLLVDNQRSG